MKKPNKKRKLKRVLPNPKNLFHSKIDSETYNKQYEDMAKGKTKNKKKFKKILIIAVSVFLAIVLLLGSAFAYLYYNGKLQFNQDHEEITIPADLVQQNGDTVESDGVKYVYDKDVETILLLGIDKDSSSQIKTDKYGTAGQADAIYLACIDNKDKHYTILQINRDSMIDVDTYSTSGQFSGIKNMQACISFAYGDGKEKSCQNTKKAISRLLFNIPIDSYFSINKASIPLLNDIIGGVDVPVYDSNGNKTGEYNYLDGKEAYEYIHYRDTSKIDSNLVRLKRQTSYIKAFAAKFIERTKADISTPVEMFETVSIYSTTDLNTSKITYLTTNAFTGRNDFDIQFKSVPGKVIEGDGGYAEYIVDTKGLLKVVLDIFYDKVETVPSTSTATTTK